MSLRKYFLSIGVSLGIIALGYGTMSYTDTHGDKLETELRRTMEASGAMTEEQRKKRLIMLNIMENMKSDRPIWDVRW